MRETTYTRRACVAVPRDALRARYRKFISPIAALTNRDGYSLAIGGPALAGSLAGLSKRERLRAVVILVHTAALEIDIIRPK